MDGRIKQRMVGAAVLLAVGVMVIPALLDESGRKQQHPLIPDAPPVLEVPEPLPLKTAPIVLTEPLAEPSKTIATTAAAATAAVATAAVATAAVATKPSNDKLPAAGVDTGELSAWVVQVGSFSEKANAEQLTNTLRAADFSAFIEVLKSNSKMTYRVRIGPQLTRKKASQIRARVAKKHAHNAVVMRYSGPPRQ